MFLALIKRLVKGALHEAVDEWALEAGVPRAAVQALRQRRQALADEAAARADEQAARALGDDEEGEEESPAQPLALPMPSAAQVTTSAATSVECPGTDADEATLLAWVHQQRQQEVPWAEIARAAADKGHPLSEGALRSRLRRWLDAQQQPAETPVEN